MNATNRERGFLAKQFPRGLAPAPKRDLLGSALSDNSVGIISPKSNEDVD